VSRDALAVSLSSHMALKPYEAGRHLISACLLVELTVTASAAPAKRAEACTWGASSVVVEQVNGQLVQSEPVATGCIPK